MMGIRNLCHYIPEFRLLAAEERKKSIRIHHECEGGIEKSVPTITDLHHKACPVMTNGDHEGRIFQSHPQIMMGTFSC